MKNFDCWKFWAACCICRDSSSGNGRGLGFLKRMYQRVVAIATTLLPVRCKRRPLQAVSCVVESSLWRLSPFATSPDCRYPVRSRCLIVSLKSKQKFVLILHSHRRCRPGAPDCVKLSTKAHNGWVKLLGTHTHTHTQLLSLSLSLLTRGLAAHQPASNCRRYYRISVPSKVFLLRCH